MRLIEQRVSENGIQESTWTADSDRTRWSNFKLVMSLLLATSPWLGVAVRFATPTPTMITEVGVLLWLCNISVLWFLYRYRTGAKQPRFIVFALFWTGQFAALYAVAIVVTNGFLRR
jgi:uncharacterized membrane protein